MRKIVLALLVLLLAVPAMAASEVRCAQVSDTNQVIVTYDDSNEIRAFGIKLSVDSGATIDNIEVNDVDYYIFPGSIDINEAGDVNDYGTAIAEQDSNSFILEMGSLYAAGDPCHTTAPPTSGWICKFTVDVDCNVAIAEDAARGGVVLADTQASFGGSLIGCEVTLTCISSGHVDYADWVLVGSPECWCYPRQCHGDADGLPEGKSNYYAYTNDLTILSNAWGKTAAQLTGNEACADFDRRPEGKSNYRAYTNDLTILSTYWGQSVPADCDPGNRTP